MSSAGHVMDMINRISNNRKLQTERYNKYAKVKQAYQKKKIKYIQHRDEEDMSSDELNAIKTRIRMELINSHKRRIILTAILTPVAVVGVIIAFKLLLNGWLFS